MPKILHKVAIPSLPSPSSDMAKFARTFISLLFLFLCDVTVVVFLPHAVH